MKQKIKKLLFYMLPGLMVLNGCQRDDICPAAVETTPLLILRFYDVNAPEEPSAPNDMTIRATGHDTILYYRIDRDSIAMPLRTDQDVTNYEFTIDAPEIDENGEIDPEEEDNSNTDVISFIYAREEIYINRACAFKVNFLDLKVAIDAGDDDNSWMQNYIIEQTDIENDSSAHISIFH